MATDQTEVVFICGLDRMAMRGPDGAVCAGVVLVPSNSAI
jgi:hypothetical protein